MAQGLVVGCPVACRGLLTLETADRGLADWCPAGCLLACFFFLQAWLLSAIEAVSRKIVNRFMVIFLAL